MVGWHRQFNGHEFEPTLRDHVGQGSLAGCSPWGRKELDTAERLGNSNIINRAPGKERASLRSVSHSS